MNSTETQAVRDFLQQIRDAVRAGPPEKVGYGPETSKAFDEGWNAAMGRVHQQLQSLVPALELLPTRLPLEETVARMKAEIQNDVRRGLIPAANISDFGDLHEHVDANEYGGFCEGSYEITDEVMEYMNAAQDAVGAWIREGGLRGPLPRA